MGPRVLDAINEQGNSPAGEVEHADLDLAPFREGIGDSSLPRAGLGTTGARLVMGMETREPTEMGPNHWTRPPRSRAVSQ